MSLTLIKGSRTPSETPAALQKFGLLLAAFLVGILGLLLPFLKGRAFPGWPWCLAIPLSGVALLCPEVLKPVQLAWCLLGEALGFINSRVILGAIYFLIITPVSLIRRLRGVDLMRRKLDPGAASYRELRDRANSGMEVPF